MVAEIKRPTGYNNLEKATLSDPEVRERYLNKATIAQIDQLIDLLSSDQLQAFNRIYQISITKAEIAHFPPGMADFIALRFKTTAASLQNNQFIVKIENKVTGEATLFNTLRSNRPNQNPTISLRAENENRPSSATCDFCHLTTNTPIDSLQKRLISRYCATAANGASYDAINCLVIPTAEYHQPENLSYPVFEDMLLTAQKWAEIVHLKNPQARYPVITWNSGRRAGQSVFPHPHLNVLAAVGKPYAEVEKLRRSLADYLYLNSVPFMDDLAFALNPLGLAYPEEVGQNPASDPKIIFPLTPKKEKEVIITSRNFDRPFAQAIWTTVDWYRQSGVTNFNLAIYLRPNSPENGWEGFPNLARLIDRGPDHLKNSDMGAMECFITPIVTSDPLITAASFRQHLKNKGEFGQ